MPIRHFENGGGTLAVEVQGTGPLVICAPGMGDVRQSYDDFATHLVAKGYTVATMDNRGHGESTAQFTTYGDEATADDFIHAAQQLKLGPAVLAGNSFAGGAATIAAGKRPDLFAGTILLGPFLRNGKGGWLLLAIISAMFWRPWGPTMWEYYAATLWPGLGDGAKKRAAESRAHLTRPERWTAFQKTVAGLDHSVVGPWISKVQAPVLVVMGEKDPDFTPVDEAAWIASKFKDAEVVMVPETGHAPQLERAEFVAEKSVAFLERLKSAGAFKSGQT